MNNKQNGSNDIGLKYKHELALCSYSIKCE